MPKPTPGSAYTVAKGDTIRNISRRAYGNDQSDLIANANSRLLAGRPISLEGLQTVRPGDVLNIPATTNRYDGRKVTADFDTQLMVKLDGIEYKGVKASNIKRGMNTIADGFTFEIPFNPSDAKLVDRLRPYSYKQAVLHIGGEPYITGICLKPSFAQSGAGGTVCTMEVRTKPGNMIDCMSSRKSIEYRNQTLLQIGNDKARRYGLKAFSTHGDSDKFAVVTNEVTQSDFDFLAKLAAQKGFLITSARDGNLLFTRATADAKPVAALRAGQFPVLSCSSSFDGTKRFSEWFGYAETPLSGTQRVTSLQRDASIPVFRPFAFSADESEASNIETAVKWRMAKSLADATAIGVMVAGWHNPDGQLWEENMKVTFWGPGVAVFKESEFILQSVALGKDNEGGDVAAFSLILPNAYSLTMPKVFPWDSVAVKGRETR